LKLRSIQVLRGIAAMAVVGHHAFDGTRIGAAGVDLFFVMSGFIMATCARDRGPLEFLADRAWRIYPLWLIAVTPWLLMSPQTSLEVVRSLTLWPVYGPHFVNPALGVGWTLSFELLFYLAFALALATRVSVPLIAYASFFILAMKTNSILFAFLGSPLALEFLMGVAVAAMPTRSFAGIAALVLGICGFALGPSDFYNQAFGAGAIYRAIAWGIPASMAVYGARSLESFFEKKSFNLPVLLGSASYSIYLFHQLVFQAFSGLAGLVISAFAGVAVYLLLERPIMRVKPHWRPPDQSHPARASLLT